MGDGLITGDLTRGQAHAGLESGHLDRPPVRRPIHENVAEIIAGGGVSGGGHAIALDPARPHAVFDLTGVRPTHVAPVPLEPAVTKSGADWALFITFGTIGQTEEASTGASIPTIGGVGINTAGAGRPKLTLGGAEACVYATVTVDTDKKVTGVVVTTSTDPTPDAGDDSTANVLLGSITWSTGDNPRPTVERNLAGSQAYAWCGGHKFATV